MERVHNAGAGAVGISRTRKCFENAGATCRAAGEVGNARVTPRKDAPESAARGISQRGKVRSNVLEGYLTIC